MCFIAVFVVGVTVRPSSLADVLGKLSFDATSSNIVPVPVIINVLLAHIENASLFNRTMNRSFSSSVIRTQIQF